MKKYLLLLIATSAFAASYDPNLPPVSVQQAIQNSPKESAPTSTTDVVTIRDGAVRRFALHSTARLIPTASTTTPGLVKVGAGLAMDAEGKLNNTGIAGVASFKGRAGAVTPATGDYTIGQISGAAPVAATGSYTDLVNKPTIPAAQVNSDWAASSGVAQILNKPTIPTALSQLTQSSLYRTVTDAEKTTWNSNSSPVQSVFGRTGTITAQSGDYTAVMVGADPLGAATSVQGNLDLHAGLINNPHEVTAAQVGLGSVDNTSDLDKPISTATQSALDAKLATTTADATYKTIATFNSYSTAQGTKDAAQDALIAGKEPADATIIKESELSIATNSTSVTTAANSAAVKAAYDLAAGKLSPTGDGSGLSGITAAQVGAATAAQGSKADKSTADEVYATDYNGGALNSTTINAAITAIGSSAKTLVLTPGAWTLDGSVTTPANITLKMQNGAVISRQGSNVLTINGPVDFPMAKVFSGFYNSLLLFGGKVPDIYIVWWGAAGDGSTDDYLQFTSFLSCAENANLHLESGKNYKTSTAVTSYRKGTKLFAHGSTVTSVATAAALSFGGWDTTYSSLSIAVTENSTTFTIPGGVPVSAGDTVILQNSTPYSTVGSTYYYGLLTTVASVSGTTATIEVPAIYSFTADKLIKVKDIDGLEIHDLTIDNSAATQVASGDASVAGLSVYGRHFLLDNVVAKGNQYAKYGIAVNGLNGVIQKCRASGYIGIPAASSPDGAGGRPSGYGLLVYGSNIDVRDSHGTDNKHSISISLGTYASSNIHVRGGSYTQTADHWGETVANNAGSYYEAVVDTHNNAKNITVEDALIVGGGGNACIYVRNGEAAFSRNSIYYQNQAGSLQGIFRAGDTQLLDLRLTDNKIAAANASTPLFNGIDYAPGAIKYSNNTMSNVAWDGITAPMNSAISSATYDATSWNGDTTHAPSKDAVRDKIEAIVASGGGAPVDAAFVTLGANSTLTNERALTGTTNRITVTDGGANGNVTLSTPQDIATGSNVTFNRIGLGTSPGTAIHALGTAPTIRLEHTTGSTSKAEITKNSDNSVIITNQSTAGASFIQFDPVPLDGTGDAYFRAFRSTNTSGSVYFDIFKGNNTTTTNIRLSGNGNSFFNASVGNVGIGTSSPAQKLDVAGVVKATAFRDTVKANGTCSTSINIDPDLGGIQTLTISGACAIGVTNIAAGQSFTLKLTQSSTTAPTFTSAYKWPAGTAPTWSTSATKYDLISCQSDDGTTLFCNGMVDVR